MSWIQRITFATLALTSAAFAERIGILESLEDARIGGRNRVLFARSTDPGAVDEAMSNRLLNEISLRAEYGGWIATVGASNRIEFEQTEQPKALQLEKKMFAYESHRWNLQLGDSYHELGRGIALALYRDEVFGLDTTLEGASAKFEDDVSTIGAFAGRINPWKSPVAINPVALPLNNRTVYLAGVSVAGNTELGRLEAHATGTFNQERLTQSWDRQWWIGGASAHLNTLPEGFDAYLESNVLVPTSKTSSEPVSGFGSYASLSYAAEGWRAQIDAKDYRKFYYEFHRPPTLEEDVVQTLNTQDVTAARLSFSRLWGPANSATAALLVGGDRMVDSSLYHGTVGSKIRFSDGIDLESKAGYRIMPGQSQLVHASLKGQLRTAPGQMLEVGYRKQHNKTNLSFLPTLDDRNYFDVSYVFSHAWSVSVGYEWVPSNASDVGQHFANLGLRAKADAVQGRAFVGQTSGGTLCSGGICRQVPPYTGAYVDATYAF